MNSENRKFDNHRSSQLLNEARYKKFNPNAIFDKIGLRPGMNVADLGCGNGFFTVPAARRVAPNGMIYALDISQQMLDLLTRRQLPENIEIYLSEENNFPLADDSIDVALASFVMHELEDRHKFLLEVRRILKAEKHLWVLEWLPKDEENGPPKQHRVSPEELQQDFTLAGFRVLWLDFIGESHYQMMVEKTAMSCST